MHAMALYLIILVYLVINRDLIEKCVPYVYVKATVELCHKVHC